MTQSDQAFWEAAAVGAMSDKELEMLQDAYFGVDSAIETASFAELRAFRADLLLAERNKRLAANSPVIPDSCESEALVKQEPMI